MDQQRLRLSDVRSMDDARALARQMAKTKNFDIGALVSQESGRGEDPAYWQAQALLAEDIVRAASGGPAAAGRRPSAAAADLPQQFAPIPAPSPAPSPAAAAPHNGSVLAALCQQLQVTDPARAEDEDSLPNTPGGGGNERGSSPAVQEVPLLLAAVEQAVRKAAQSDAAPASVAPPQPPAASHQVPAQVQAQLEAQQQQLAALAQLQQRLVLQQELQAQAVASSMVAPPQPPTVYPPLFPSPRRSPRRAGPPVYSTANVPASPLPPPPPPPAAAYDPPVFGPATPRVPALSSPVRARGPPVGRPAPPMPPPMPASLPPPMPPMPQPGAGSVPLDAAPRFDPHGEAVAAAAEAEAARQRAAAAEARLRHGEAVLRSVLGGGAPQHSPALPAPTPVLQPPAQPARVALPPPPPPPADPADLEQPPGHDPTLQSFHSGAVTASLRGSDCAEELEAREQANRLMVDLVEQRNLSNVLTGKLARKTQEVEELQSQVCGGEQKVKQMAAALGTYERELGQERSRTLGMEHEIQRLHGELETSGVPAARSRMHYEEEVHALRSRIAEQEVALAEMRQRAQMDRVAAARADAGGGHGQEYDDLRNEISLLRQKLKEKKQVNQELQDMLRLHLRYNAEIGKRSVVQQPSWVHPLAREPQPPEDGSGLP